MVKPLHVVLPALRGSAHDLSGVADALRAGLGALDEQITGLVGTSWSGDASAEYSKVWQQWHEGAGSVISGWQTFSELLARTEKAYRETSGGGSGGAE